ncbi:UNKNOWN [Stylonychia lemnae]|uniref:Uncharacterized protein n=1 Tax=Stylonychia lemnae TaxID=5949 RepID=A0A078A1S9_STYLE|nr:UNKNOWN [Stylonychia lemnae]|eukprot:CDW74739.1 UNKNOWN [Stylonychia lemnae]
MKKNLSSSIFFLQYLSNRSIRNSIQYGYAKDKQRAQKILDIELDNNSDSEYEQPSASKNDFSADRSSSKYQSEIYKKEQQKLLERTRKIETLFEDKIMNLKSEQFIAIEEKNLGFTKKRFYKKNEVRGLQSKINLKFPIKEMLHDRAKEAIKVKEGHTQEFDKIYNEQCNPQFQRNKNRNVSNQSPFDKNNVPPKQYLEDDYVISKSPNKMSPNQYDASKIPLAGRVSEIGHRILELGSRRALYITSIQLGNQEGTTNTGYNNPFQESRTSINQEKSPKNRSPNQKDNVIFNSEFNKYLYESQTLVGTGMGTTNNNQTLKSSMDRIQLPQIDINPYLKKGNDGLANQIQYLQKLRIANISQLTTPNQQSTDDLQQRSIENISPANNGNKNFEFGRRSQTKLKPEQLARIKEIRRHKNEMRMKSKRDKLSRSMLDKPQSTKNKEKLPFQFQSNYSHNISNNFINMKSGQEKLTKEEISPRNQARTSSLFKKSPRYKTSQSNNNRSVTNNRANGQSPRASIENFAQRHILEQLLSRQKYTSKNSALKQVNITRESFI